MNDASQKYFDILNDNLSIPVDNVTIKQYALEEIGKVGTIFDIKFILAYFIQEEDKIISNKSLEIIVKLLARRNHSLIWLDLCEDIKNYFLYQTFSKNLLNSFLNFDKNHSIHLLGLASFSANGYIREQALEHLDKFSSPELLPYILLHLNDWVPQVQKKAANIFEKIFPLVSLFDLYNYYEIIKWLMNVRRVDLTFIKQHINHKIRDPLNRIDLLKILSKADNKERLFFLKTIESKIIDDQQLMEIMLNDKIPQVRMILAKYLFKGFKHPKSFLDILLKDKSALVRYAALSNIPNNQFITYKEYFEPAIFDDYKAIREYARYILKTQGYSDYMEKYREKIIQCFSSLNTGIIVGLAEICEYQDINLISNFINHRNCKVRAAVLSAYYRVKLADQDYLYLNAIRDKSFKVRKIAIFILSQKNNREIKKALEILLYQENFKTKSAALEVLSSFNELESLQYILITLSLDDNNMANLAWQKLTSWYNHNQYQLWFNYDYAVYQNIMKLIEKIKIKNVKIPDFASKLWKDLPDIMHIIAKG